MSGTLYVIGTPIGNRNDITLRALEELRDCDVVVAEDSRRTRQLLHMHALEKPVVSFPAFAEQRRTAEVLTRLSRGEQIVFCTDAGTPGISDPGAFLVRAAREQGHKVHPIPGVSALTAALSASGVDANSFIFLGFLPRTPGKLSRKLSAALGLNMTVAFFESGLRLGKTMLALTKIVPDRRVVIARELTKIHESFHQGTTAELAEMFAKQAPRGECTVIVEGE